MLTDAKVGDQEIETDKGGPPVVSRPRHSASRQALAEAFSGGADIGALIRGQDGKAARVLIYAADRGLCGRLNRVLAFAGCVIAIAGSLDEALAATNRDPPDLVVADIDLLVGTTTLVARLASQHGTDWLPVITVGSEHGERARQTALALGADEYLQRPFGARELLSRVGLYLAMARVGREASEAVRVSEQRLGEVLETIGEAVFALDCDERILFANRKALELWKLSPEAVIGRHLLEVFPDVADGEPYRAYREVLTTRETRHIEAQAPALANRWIGLDVNPAPNGGIVVAFRDIDERKRADARLRESEERFRLMLETLPDIAFVIRPDGTAEYYNERLRAYAGHPIGPHPADRSSLHPPEDRPRVDEARARGFAAGEDFVVEARMRRHDGAYRWHRIRNRPVRIDGEIAFWLGTAVDIDDMREANASLEDRVAERTAALEAANRRLATQIEEREKTEARLRQAERIEAVGQLTSGVAHDFNNLLTAILGNLELMGTQIDPDNARLVRLLGAAIGAAERGARLTAQLLAFSRQQRMVPESIDLNHIVNSMGGLLQSTIGGTVRIETVLSATLWPALADGSQIELVLLNLAINARDAMPAGGAIAIETANVTLGPPERPEEPPAGDYVMVAVSDTGTGIPSMLLDKVFDPFFTTKEVGKGSGLGLSQVLGVAQQLGGGVRIDTRAGAGTSVKVYLPRAHTTGAREPGQTSVHDLHREPRGEGVVLLVDDDADVRMVAATMLHDAGYEVVEVGSGYAALEALAAPHGGRIRLLIADVVMPGMNGVELAHTARNSYPDLPVLFVTGFAGAALPAEGLQPHQLLRKPFRAAELITKVVEMLDAANNTGNVVQFPNSSAIKI